MLTWGLQVAWEVVDGLGVDGGLESLRMFQLVSVGHGFPHGVMVDLEESREAFGVVDDIGARGS
jgi:hypothetical protein